MLHYSLASSKMSGSSLASFSLPTSAIGPKITTGLRNPAVEEREERKANTSLNQNTHFFNNNLLKHPNLLVFVKHKSMTGQYALTFPQHHPLIGRELGLDRLGRQVLPAFPQIPLGASQPSESPEVRPVSTGCFREGVLHTG